MLVVALGLFEETNDEGMGLVGIDLELPSIQSQEHVRRKKSDALVPVYEWVVHQ